MSRERWSGVLRRPQPVVCVCSLWLWWGIHSWCATRMWMRHCVCVCLQHWLCWVTRAFLSTFSLSSCDVCLSEALNMHIMRGESGPVSYFSCRQVFCLPSPERFHSLLPVCSSIFGVNVETKTTLHTICQHYAINNTVYSKGKENHSFHICTEDPFRLSPKKI